MKNFSADTYGYNKIAVKGYVFSHELEIRTYKNPDKSNFGERYINGHMNIAIDDDAVKTVPVYVNFLNEKKKNGDTNESFTILEGLINNDTTVVSKGKDNALCLDIQGRVEDNTFYSVRNESLVETQRLCASFIHVQNSSFKGNAAWQTDTLVYAYTEIEPENDEVYGEIKGYAFNYRNEFVPVKYRVTKESGGMDYFASKEISANNPFLARIAGFYNVTTVTSNKSVEMEFGVASIEPTSYSRETWDVSGIMGTPYDFGDESVMTMDDVKRLKAIRDEYVAGRKVYAESRAAQSNGGSKNVGFDTAKTSDSKIEADVAAGGFVF